jgi:hypothetical protein
MKKKFIEFFAGLTMVFLMFLLLGCASTPKLEDYKRISFQEFQKILNDVASSRKRPKQGIGFVVEGYITSTSRLCDTPDSKGGIYLNFAGGTERKNYLNLYGDYDCMKYHSHRQAANYERTSLMKHIDTTKKHIVYVGFYRGGYDSYGTWWEACIDKIEGLRTTEDVANIEAKKKAEQATEAEAKRKAEEEANRYDPSRFTIVPSDFKPANYTSIDLFTAVANVEKMPRGNGSFGDSLFATRLYVSEVVFVSQNGTDIQFKTSDNAISQSMKVDGRSGLSAGQRVRLYYRVTKNPLTEWRVVAIEKL